MLPERKEVRVVKCVTHFVNVFRIRDHTHATVVSRVRWHTHRNTVNRIHATTCRTLARTSTKHAFRRAAQVDHPTSDDGYNEDERMRQRWICSADYEYHRDRQYNATSQFYRYVLLNQLTS